MARPGRQTHAKRQREFAKQETRRVKHERRAARKAAKESGTAIPSDALSGDESADVTNGAAAQGATTEHHPTSSAATTE
jgi:hypothetical protein